MKKPPLISIVVPIYNVKQYLNKCVDSLLAQSYENIEIILVDDGSTDGSGMVADSYAKIDTRIRIIHKCNGGLSSARNEGIKHSSGEWIAFVDSDDYVKKDFLLNLYNHAKKNDADISTCSLIPFSDDDSALKKIPDWSNNVMSGYEAVDDMLKNKRPAYICLSIFKASLFKNNNIVFPNGRNYEDIATRINLFCHAKRIVFSNEQLYFYLIRKESITGEGFTKSRYDDYMYAIESVEKILKQFGQQKEFIYLCFFKFYSMFTLLNYLAREKKLNKYERNYWRLIRRELARLYKAVKFPSNKDRLKYLLLLTISYDRVLYSRLYRRMKK